MKKKMLAMLLALAMVLTSVPSTVYATGDSGTDDNAVTTEVDGQTDDADADNQSEEDVDQDADDADDTIVDTEENENTPAATSEEGEEATEQGEDAWYNAEATELIIDSVEDLVAFKDKVNEGVTFAGITVKLGADIDLANKEWEPIGNWNSSVFSGTFDGQNHSIKNMTITKENVSGTVRLGLFGYIKNATIQNLIVEQANISADATTARGAVVVMCADGTSNTISGVTVKNSTVTMKSGGQTYACGVVAWANSGTSMNMSDISVTGLNLRASQTDSSYAKVAPVIGYLENDDGKSSSLDNFNVSDVTIEVNAPKAIAGGVFGDINKGSLKVTNGKVDNVVMNITGTGSNENDIGGLIGYTYKVDHLTVEGVEITNLDIDFAGSSSKVGGVTGRDQSVSDYKNVTVSGSIDENITSGSGSEVGGFVGISYYYPKTYNDCSADVDIVTGNRAGGFVGTPCTNGWSNQTDAYTNCTASGDVTAPVAGGFVGCAWLNNRANTTLLLDNVTATGTVTGTTHAGGLIGGAFGPNGCSNINIIDSVASENVTGPEGNTGGVVGNMNMASGKYLTLEDVSYTVEPAYPAAQEANVIIIAHAARIGDVKYDTLSEAITKAQEGDEVVLLKDIDYGTNQLTIDNAITLNLGGKTLTTRNAYGGMSLKGNCTIKNGTIVHASNTAAIKVWNAESFENLVIDVQGKGDANKTIGGIVVQSGSISKVGSIKNVTIKGEALTNGIETYNCGDAAESVIGSMENVIIDAKGTGMLVSAPCGTATNCDIKGGTSGIEIWIKGTYSATLDLKGCTVEGGEQAFYAHDEFSSNPDITNNGALKITIDDETFDNIVGAPLKLIIARAENVHIDEKLLGEAKIGDIYYKTLEDAIAAANEKTEDVIVELVRNAAVGEALTVSGNIVLDGNGKTITWEDNYTGTIFNVEADRNLSTKNLIIDGGNAFTFYEGTATVENGQNWYTRFVDVGEEDKAVNADVIVNAGNLTLGEGTKIQNVTIASDSENGKTENTETGGYVLKYNDDLAIIKSNGGIVNLTSATISVNAGLVLNAVNAETTIKGTTIEFNMGAGNKGGIVIANGGTMAIGEASSISNNKAMARSATILGVINGAEVTFNATMDNNKQIGVGNNTAGAMVVLEGASQFVMNGGSISNNVGGRAGAIASRWVGGNYGQHEETSIILNTGTIAGNTTSNDSWNNASVFLRSSATIGEGMTVEGTIAVNAAPGELDITGGTFNGSLVVTDELRAEITGGTFDYDPEEWCAEGYAGIENGNGTWTVTNYIKWIKAELLAGHDVTLERDIVVDGSMIESIPASTNGNGKYPNYAVFTVIGETLEDKEVTFDLNGHSITYNGHKDFEWNGKTYNSCTVAHGLFYANAGADLTIVDNSEEQTGTVTVYGLASGAYCASNDTKLTIEGGTWINKGCKTCDGMNLFIYPLQGGEIYITGGYFEQDLDSEDKSYLLVEHGGEYKNSVIDYSKTKLEVSGGTFVGMNPEEAQYFQQTVDNKLVTGETKNVVAEGYESVYDEEKGWYTIRELDYVEWVKEELLAGRDVTLDRDIVIDGTYVDSIPAATNGNGDYFNPGIFNVVGDTSNVTFDLNGHTITYNGHATVDYITNSQQTEVNACEIAHGVFFVNDGANLTIVDNSEAQTGAVTVYGMASGVYAASPDSTITIEGGKWSNEGCKECGGTNLFLYASHGGELYIKGGEFKQSLDSEWNSYLIVEHGGSAANSVVDFSKTKIEVTGGTFYGMNPEEAVSCVQNNWTSQTWGTTNVVAVGYTSKQKGNANVWIVQAVDEVAAVVVGEEVIAYYDDVTEALEAAKNDASESQMVTVKLLKEYTETDVVVVPAYVNFDLGGKVLTADNVLAFGNVIDTAEVVGGINISNDTTKAIVQLQPENGGYLPIYDTSTESYRFFEVTVEAAAARPNGSEHSVKFGFKMHIDEQARDIIIKSTPNTGFSYVVELNWSGLARPLEYDFKADTLIEYLTSYSSSKAMVLTVTGLDKLPANGFVSATPYIESVTKVIVNEVNQTTLMYNN